MSFKRYGIDTLNDSIKSANISMPIKVIVGRLNRLQTYGSLPFIYWQAKEPFISTRIMLGI